MHIALHLQKDGGEFILKEMILHRNLMKLEKGFTGEHVEALLACNYILSQSCLQMNIFWLLTQSQVAACLTPGRVYIDTGANMQVMAFEGDFGGGLATALHTQIIKLADNQTIK